MLISAKPTRSVQKYLQSSQVGTGCLQSCRTLLAAYRAFLGLQTLYDISCRSCFCGYELLLRVKPPSKQEGLQSHSVLLSRASGHLLQFLLSTLVLRFVAQKNTSIWSSMLDKEEGSHWKYRMH